MNFESSKWTRDREATEAVIVHSITRAETAKELDIIHRRAGYFCAGVHFVVDASGSSTTRHPDTIGHHLSGWDTHSIGVAIVGWDGKDQLPADLEAHAHDLLDSIYHHYHVTAVAAPTLLGIEGYGPLQELVREANARRPTVSREYLHPS